MKYATYGLLAAFLASGVHGAIPDTASGWYTPSGGKFETKDSYGEVWYFDEDGEWTNAEVTVDENGKVTGFEGGVDILDAAFPAYQAMLSALKAETIAKQNTERIQTIGENLYALTSKDGIHIRNEKTGQEFTIKFGGSIASAVSGASSDIPATSDAEYPVDGRSLKLLDAGTVKKIEIGGWNTQASSGNILDATDPIDIPVRETTGGAHMMYRTWSGVDGLTLVKNGAGKMGIAGWDSAPSGLATPLADVLTKPVSERDMFDNYKIVVRNANKGLNYVDVGELDVGMKADGESVTTNETDGAISLYGWESSGSVESLADFLTVNEEASSDMPTYEVLARCTDGEDVSLEYLSLGNLYGVTWATNWTEAIEHITKEETIKIVNWTTNWVNYTENVTNYYDVVNWVTNWVEHSLFVTNYEDVVNVVTNMVYHENFITNMFYHENFITNTWNHENFVTNMFYHENFITNVINHEDFVTNVIEVYSSITNFENFVNFQTNMFYNEVFITNVIDKYSTISNFENFVTFQTNTFENLRTIENWTYVTNYIVRYLGGGGRGSGEGGEDYGPAIEPEDDPYSPVYEPQEIDEDLLPVKNARMLVAITNSPFSKLDAHKMLDFRSVDTNGSSRAQVFGFANAPENAIPIKKRKDGEPVLEWVDFPTNLVNITTNEIEEIRKWMRTQNVNNIFNTTVTNAERFAEMRTNFFSQVAADTLLDGESVWTNGSRMVEVKGYRNAAAYTVPYLDVTQATVESGRDKELVWERLPFADSDANIRFGVIDAPFSISAEEWGTPDSDYTFKMLSLYGFGDASDGQVPVKQTQNGHETLAWTNLQAEVSADGASITNVEGVLTLNGYTAADVGAVPQKTEHGLTWFKSSSATNIILAGAGINITDNGGGAITISAQSLSESAGGSGATSSIAVVTAMRYDEATHKLQYKTRTLTFVGSIGSESSWQDVFTAVSHASEHEQQGGVSQ